MRLLSIYIFLFINSCFSQTDENTKFFSAILTKEPLIHVSKKSIPESLVKQVKVKLQEETIAPNDFFWTEEKRELTLDENERAAIFNALDQIVDLKSVVFLKEIKKVKIINRFNLKKHHSSNTFSKPIFFRDNTICLIYTASYKGPESSAGGWKLYKKENDDWKFWFSITSYIS